MRRWSCGRPTTWTTGSMSIPHFFHLIYCACTGEAVKGQLPGQLEVCLSHTSYIQLIAHAQVKLWKANYQDNWKCDIPHFSHLIYYACAVEAVEGQPPGQLEVVYPSLLPFNLLRMRRLSCGRPTTWTTGSVSIPHFLHLIIAHAQVKLWKANYLDNWKCVYPSLHTFNLFCMCRWSCGRPATWTTGSVSNPHFIHLIYCACAGEAVEGRPLGQLEVRLSLTSYI